MGEHERCREERDHPERHERLLGLRPEEKQREDHRGEKRICPRLSGVKKEERRQGDEEDEPDLRARRGKASDARENRERREKRKKTGGDVRRKEAFAAVHERFFKKVEERRARVVPEDGEELAWGQPRCPDREDLVEPQRAVNEEPRARESGEQSDDRGRRERETVAALR